MLDEKKEWTLQEMMYVCYDWERPGNARENQKMPEGDWDTWLILAGRGFGKTRCACEAVRKVAENGTAKRIALIGKNPATVRDVIIEGESGLLSICPPWAMPKYEPSKRRLTWPNGAIAICYSSEAPENLRGAQHDFAFCDELASWKSTEAFYNMQLGLRLGDHPRCVVATTPRPKKSLIDLMKSPLTHVTRGTTFDNLDNLPNMFKNTILERYENTRLGRQELYADILMEADGALWTRDLIEKNRIKEIDTREIRKIVVAIDPAVTSSKASDETGIIVAGFLGGKAYILEDATCRKSPHDWARKAIDLYLKYNANMIVGEANNGGDLIRDLIYQINPTVAYQKVHASRGKHARAEPVSSYYERGKVVHVGCFPDLEDQMCSFTGKDDSEGSPDRLDAMVWAVTYLLDSQSTFNLVDISKSVGHNAGWGG